MIRTLGALILIVLLGGAYVSTKFVYDAYFTSPDPNATEVHFEVTPGESIGEVVKRLEEQGVIHGSFPFKFFLKFTSSDTTFQAGSFSLKSGMSFTQLAAALSRAAAQEVEVTIPEGYTAKQIGEAVRQALPNIDDASWNAAVGPDSPLKGKEGWKGRIPEGKGLEGFLFPDTYRFRADADALTVAETMLVNFDRRFAQVDASKLPKEAGTEYSVIVLASIVEREVRSPEDMQKVADIFLKRLRDGMPLQADSTVNYVINGKTASITTEDSKIDSPYNTYRYPGLPPGPISNPGLTAIQAVFAPEKNDFYYFLTDPEGKVYYARTYAEHLENRRLHLR
jgi:UPF0755 protein